MFMPWAQSCTNFFQAGNALRPVFSAAIKVLPLPPNKSSTFSSGRPGVAAGIDVPGVRDVLFRKRVVQTLGAEDTLIRVAAGNPPVRQDYIEVKPSRMAYLVSPAIEDMFNFFMMFRRCASTVRTPMCNNLAVCEVIFPSAIDLRTSLSRLDRAAVSLTML